MQRLAPATIAMAAALAVSASRSWAQGLVLDTFNAGSKPNALGGDFGSWNVDPQDRTQYTRDSFNQPNALGGSGYCLRLDYDVDSPNPAYNGFWSKLNRVDLRSYQALTFYVKGDSHRGFTRTFRIELKNVHGETGRTLVQGVTNQWQAVRVPLGAFAGLTDWRRMTEFVIVFDDLTTEPKTGTLYLDELVFE